MNGIQYLATYDQVITDEKMIDKQIGTISEAPFLKNGTEAFSDNNDSIPNGNGIEEDTYSAMSLIVQKVDSEETQKIDDKEKIKLVFIQ